MFKWLEHHCNKRSSAAKHGMLLRAWIHCVGMAEEDLIIRWRIAWPRRTSSASQENPSLQTPRSVGGAPSSQNVGGDSDVSTQRDAKSNSISNIPLPWRNNRISRLTGATIPEPWCIVHSTNSRFTFQDRWPPDRKNITTMRPISSRARNQFGQ